MHLHPDWKNILEKAWSIRLSILFAAISGLYAAWGAFQWVLPPYAYSGLSILMSILICVARITGQKGLDGQ